MLPIQEDCAAVLLVATNRYEVVLIREPRVDYSYDFRLRQLRLGARTEFVCLFD
jgi:hypothetical protein